MTNDTTIKPPRQHVTDAAWEAGGFTFWLSRAEIEKIYANDGIIVCTVAEWDSRLEPDEKDAALERANKRITELVDMLTDRAIKVSCMSQKLIELAFERDAERARADDAIAELEILRKSITASAFVTPGRSMGSILLNAPEPDRRLGLVAARR